MNKIIATELYKTDPEKFDIFRKWGSVNDKVHNFENKATLNTFQYLFGDEEGLRLIKHFRNNCNGNVLKFKTYLLPEQYNDLLVNIYYNENLFIM